MQKHVAATHRSDKSLRVYCRNFVKIFVSATEFCRRDKSHKFCLILQHVAATKFCRRDNDFHKNSQVHTKRFVACCCNLSPSVYRPLYESMIIFIGCTTQKFLESIILKEIFHFWFSIKSAIGRIITYDSMNPPPPLKKNP